VARLDVGAQRGVVDDEATGQVEEDAPARIRVNCSSPNRLLLLTRPSTWSVTTSDSASSSSSVPHRRAFPSASLSAES
jgi:hypothetical protein